MSLPRTERWSGYRRTILGLVALAFAGIFLCAPLLTRNLHMGPFSNHTVHKVGHVVVYGGLTIVLAYGLGGRWLLSGAIVMAISSAAEFQQLFIPGRCASWGDVARNFIAVCLALAVGQAFEAARRGWSRRGTPTPVAPTVG